jgi:SNF family Na+-dependent transporter
MSVGIGVLILYGSYREKKEDITRAAIGIPLLTMACGLIGGLVVFSYIGYICHLSNIPID